MIQIIELRVVKVLMVLGLIGLVLLIPNAIADLEINQVTGRLDKVRSTAEIQHKSIGGESLWTLDSDLDIIPRTLTNIWQGLWNYNGSQSISPATTISTGLWKLNSNDALVPNGTYNIDGLWYVDTIGNIYPRG